MVNIILTSLVAALLGFSIASNSQSFSAGATQSENTANQSYDTTRMSSSELGSPTQPSQESLSTVQRVINELGNATSDEIATYPINDLSPDLLVKVLNGLSVDSLYKVLHGLPHDELKTLLVDKLTPQVSKQVLNRLPQGEKVDIQNKSRF
jgi:hypothetical protein